MYENHLHDVERVLRALSCEPLFVAFSQVFPLERGAVAYSCKLFRLDDGMDSFVGVS